MCGIVGVIGNSSVKNIEKALAITHHRGPDDHGVFHEENCYMGMNRLAIIDTSGAGHQPMITEDNRYVIVYNGEIYNFKNLKQRLLGQGYKFNSNSDTEVLLKLYQKEGIEALKQIRGMFAFSIWDRKEKILIAARDHFGIKPFYYALENNTFYFSSEIKTFKHLNLKSEVNNDALIQYLSLGYVPQPQTIYNNIHCLLPGQYLIYKNGNIDIRNYWQLQEKNKYKNLSYQEAIEETKSHFIEAVEEQIISDVPLGTFLSGGLDSTLITAAMKAVGVKQIETFSVGFDNLGSSIDESNDALISANWYKTNHNHLVIRQEEIPGILSEFLTKLDQPTVDGLNTFCVSKFARKKVTVALSGLGADEVFGGYTAFKNILKLRQWGKIPVNYDFLKFIPKSLSTKRYNQVKKALGLSSTSALFSQSYRYYSPEDVIKDISTNGWNRSAIDLNIYKSFLKLIDPNTNNFQQIVQLFLQTHMSARLLRDSDIFSMSSSLELRVPFLDYRLVELAYSVPPNYHIESFEDSNSRYYGKNKLKRLLFEAFEKELPSDFGKRKKTGFGLPYENWMKTVLKEMIYDTLNTENKWVNIEAQRERLANWENGKSSWSTVWNLFILCNWLNNHEDL